MDATAPTGVASSVALPRSGVSGGSRDLRLASLVGLVGQIVVWGSAIFLWIVGALYSNIPVRTFVQYGTNGLSVPAGTVFAVNGLVILGALVAILSFVLAIRGFRRFAQGTPRLNFDAALALLTLGTIGLAMFALGWATWLGSFVPPGPSTDPSAYAPVMGSNLTELVDLLLGLGGFLAFLGYAGVALASSGIGSLYEEVTVELGGALSAFPILSVVGQALAFLGFGRLERKVDGGWTPPPPPPPPAPPVWVYPGGYVTPVPVAAPGQQGSWDALAAVLIVVVVLLWALVLPIGLIIASNSLTKGPGQTPPGSGGAPSAGSSSSSGGFSALPFLVLAIAGTAVLLPFAIVRNRRKQRERNTRPPVPPPPPPPPPPPAKAEDPLDHLV